MKKRFLSILSVVTAVLITIFSSGCTDSSPLAFTNAFLGGNTNDATASYTEHVTYKVEFSDNYNSRLKKSEAIDDSVVTYSFNNGTFTTDLSVASFQDIPTGITVKNDDIIYHFKTEFSIAATYKLKGTYSDDYASENEDGKTYNDTIKSEVYFLKAGQSFAPLYSKVEQKFSLLYIGGDTASVAFSESVYETVYSSGSYKTTATTDGESSNKTCEYSYKQAIDNVQLLFALRNINISSGGTYALPTIAPAYDGPQTLSVFYDDDTSVSRTINDNTTADSIKVKNLSFSISSSNYNTGIPQYVLIQTAASANLENKALLVEYAAPIVSYGSFATMGALVYKIQSVTISE